MKSYGVTIQMKPLQQYFHVILLKLTFDSVDEILWCYHSSETSSAVVSHGTIYYVCSSNFCVCEWNPMLLPFKWNLFGSTLHSTVYFGDFRRKKTFFSEFYLWSLVEILSKFKVILNVIFRWRKKSEWMFKWRRKCKTSPSSVSMCFHSTLCQATEEVWVELDAEYTHQQV